MLSLKRVTPANQMIKNIFSSFSIIYITIVSILFVMDLRNDSVLVSIAKVLFFS